MHRKAAGLISDMERDDLLKELNALGDWLGKVDEQIQKQADRELNGAIAAYPKDFCDPKLAAAKNSLVELSGRIVERMQSVHDALVSLPEFDDVDKDSE
jgi:hypothetical protein